MQRRSSRTPGAHKARHPDMFLFVVPTKHGNPRKLGLAPGQNPDHPTELAGMSCRRRHGVVIVLSALAPLARADVKGVAGRGCARTRHMHSMCRHQISQVAFSEDASFRLPWLPLRLAPPRQGGGMLPTHMLDTQICLPMPSWARHMSEFLQPHSP